MLGAEHGGDVARVGELVVLAGLPKPTEKVLTGSVIIRDIIATIRLESRPPLSIAPSGHVAHQPQPHGLLELAYRRSVASSTRICARSTGGVG